MAGKTTRQHGRDPLLLQVVRLDALQSEPNDQLLTHRRLEYAGQIDELLVEAGELHSGQLARDVGELGVYADAASIDLVIQVEQPLLEVRQIGNRIAHRHFRTDILSAVFVETEHIFTDNVVVLLVRQRRDLPHYPVALLVFLLVQIERNRHVFQRSGQARERGFCGGAIPPDRIDPPIWGARAVVEQGSLERRVVRLDRGRRS